MDLVHHLLLHLHLETKVNIMVRIHRTSELDLHSLRVVWHKEVTGILHVLSVVELTQGNKAQSSSVAPPDRATPRGATSVTGGGENCLYAITSRQDQENSPDVVTSMIKVFTLDV
ncbi:hypothetical protein H5410_061798 [Solanum commersonii]|uniref:Uncharacterized protein n=1 Tax=Solanum commersonii TaxID=4109 RepID=A0A9J5WAA0_SOLCO|nr:hypothetical protein H5410_061798 [Solanum commersonii]